MRRAAQFDVFNHSIVGVLDQKIIRCQDQCTAMNTVHEVLQRERHQEATENAAQKVSCEKLSSKLGGVEITPICCCSAKSGQLRQR